MIHYYVRLKKLNPSDGGGYLAEFPELEGCITDGKTKERALENAAEALNGWLAARCDRNLNIPEPIERRSKVYHPIMVDLNIELPILLRQMRKKKRLSQSAIAKKLDISQQAYAKLENPDTANPSLLTLQKIGEVLGIEIDFKLVA